MERLATPTALPTELALWTFSLDTEPQPALLSPDERERAARFRFPRDQRRYTVTRSTLRQLLAAALEVAPESLAFRYGPNGKPELVGRTLAFNLSHSAERALVVLGGEAPLGVDLEAVRTDFDPCELARPVFSKAEQAALAALPEPERPAAFFTTWTRKEALIKAEGGGFGSPLLERTVWPELEPSLAHWQVLDLRVAPGFFAAVAVPR